MGRILNIFYNVALGRLQNPLNHIDPLASILLAI